ncbi:MAG: 3-dehydroquinate synthase [Eubacterium sp.]|nr:3-dehydroquinate synthase [Eubacterium sp.]
MEDRKLTVRADGKPVYDIMIEDSFMMLPLALQQFEIHKKKLCIVTDSTVAEYYLDSAFRLLQPLCASLKIFMFQAGEASKNLNTVSRLYEFLIRNHFDRKDILIALGGGVTGDLTGFAASTYLRGIDFIQVPTSLLAQVDSSIGGKTGVDFQDHKNMVGAFYMPRLVYINTSTLATLSEREFHSGLGEVIKHGLIRDRNYYDWILENRDEIAARDPETLAEMVAGSCRIKREVVEEDPREEGIRAVLNFGHTLGHAIEKLSGFSLTHGECVGIGCRLAGGLSARRGLITEEDYRQIEDLFDGFSFPPMPEDLRAEDIIEETHHDKKMEHGKIRFILLDGIGHAAIYKDVTDEDLASLLADDRNDGKDDQ